MATHSSVLAWRIPGTGEPGGLPPLGSQSRTRLKRFSSSSSSSTYGSNRWIRTPSFFFFMIFVKVTNIVLELGLRTQHHL